MNAYKRLKKRVYEVIGPTKKGDIASTIFDVVLCLIVVLSCAAVIVDLFFNISDTFRQGIVVFEQVTVALFILEYIVRLWVSELEYPECNNKAHAIWEFLTSFDSLIDVISIASVLFNEIPKELAFLRMIKLIKLVRLVKISDYIKASGKGEDRMRRIKIRVNEIIDKGNEGDIPSKIFDIASVILIFLSVLFVLVETFPLPDGAHRAIYIFEVVIACLFSVEYVLRVWTAPMDYPELRPDKARMKYIFSFMSLVDLLSIIPIFVANLPTATGILKIFKLCKILRLLKASRYLSSIANFARDTKEKEADYNVYNSDSCNYDYMLRSDVLLREQGAARCVPERIQRNLVQHTDDDRRRFGHCTQDAYGSGAFYRYAASRRLYVRRARSDNRHRL